MKKNHAILFRKWYTSIDRVSMMLVMAIILLGIVISITATMPFAARRSLNTLSLAKQHIIVAFISIAIMIVITLFSSRHIKTLSCVGYAVCILLMFATFFIGMDIKGARRWIKIFGFSLQPSEFLKPIVAVITADLLSKQYDLTTVKKKATKSPSITRKLTTNYIVLSCAVLMFVIVLLIKQPDFGMAFVLSTGYITQLFVAGIAIKSVAFLMGIFACLSGVAYALLPHVKNRINAFLFGVDGEMSYQLSKSLMAIKSGGLFGKGAGNGTIKQSVPDMHSDFVLSVIAEEFGILLCLAIFTVFLVVTIRSMIKVINTNDMFRILLVLGLSIQILTQVFINVSSSVGLVPTKGITLPFFSYGGSSMLSSAISFGLIIYSTKTNANIKIH